MSIFRSETKLKKLANWVAKIATLIVSAPATVSVAKQAYADVPGIAQWLVIGACVVLVEAAFVYFWLRVEFRSSNITKDAQLQASDVLGCWVMYGVLLYAGVLHGEGFFTLLFRASIGLLLFVATRDRLVATKAKLEEMVANGNQSSKKIERLKRKANERIESAIIKKDETLRKQLIEADEDLLLSRIAKEKIFANLSIQAQEIPEVPQYKKKRKTGEKLMETENYKISQIDDQFEVSCKMCDYHTLKPTRKQAVLSGNSHYRVHTNGNGHKHVRLFAVQSSSNE